MDMSSTIAPKSDQLNSDDLIVGPRTITVTRVSGCPSPEQPVAVHFDGDDGKPYMPCKSMRRVLVALWGPDASQYTGRSMRLYRDPDVLFGGMKVGGIRISHMSHIERETVLALTATKASRKPFTVKPLPKQEAAPKQATGEDKAKVIAATLADRIAACGDMDALRQITGNEKVVQQRAWLAKNRPELAEMVDQAVRFGLGAFDQPDADEADLAGLAADAGDRA